MNEIYKEIGLFLKTKRLKRNLTEEKIAKKTNISIQNIINIENGKFESLHGDFYQKSFIKLYCKALRIDNKKLIALLDQTKEQRGIIKEDKSISGKKEENFFYNKMLPSKGLMIATSIFLFLFFSINFFYNSYFKNEQLANINPKPELDIEPIKKNNFYEDIEDVDKFKQTNYDFDTNNNEFSILKQIVAKEDVWVEIKDADQNILISTILKKDETFLLPNNGKIIISASNAGAISFKSGNQELLSLGNNGKVLNSENLATLINKH